MSDDGLMQQLWRALQGSTVPTPFGWTPMQNAIPSRHTVADVAGYPADAAAWLWRQSDMNAPELQERFYSRPPMLGSDSIRGMLGGDPGPTPGRAWITPTRNANPRGGTPPDTMPAAAPRSVFDVLGQESFRPSVLSAATRRGR